jgi:UDP-N-acetyl-D-glucosamine/UDP-N-acetyl-D-galactosamine dehydrogenase
MAGKRLPIKGARALVLGLTFKENCPDIRNSKVVDVITELKHYGVSVDVYAPWIDNAEAQHEYGIKPIKAPKAAAYDAIVLAVAHQAFKDIGLPALRRFGRKTHVFYDIKYAFPAHAVDGRL